MPRNNLRIEKIRDFPEIDRSESDLIILPIDLSIDLEREDSFSLDEEKSLLNEILSTNDDYHFLEDYLRYMLLKNDIFPRSYIIIFHEIMVRRLRNAKKSRLDSFDARHAKAQIISLLTISLHLSRRENPMLQEVFHFHSRFIFDYLKKFEDRYRTTVQSSLSIFSKMKNPSLNANGKSLKKEDHQYRYALQWAQSLISPDKTILIEKIQQDHYINELLKYKDSYDLSHRDIFHVSFEKMEEKISYLDLDLDLDLDHPCF